MGVHGLRHALPALLSDTKSGVHCTGRWVFFAPTLNGFLKSRFRRVSNSRQSRMKRIATPTTLTRPQLEAKIHEKETLTRCSHRYMLNTKNFTSM